MEHLLATRVIRPASLGRSISDNGVLVGDEGFSTCIAFVGRAGYNYRFLYGLWTLMRGPDTIFSELKLASLKYFIP
jgi:hypothetical protein